MRAAIFGFGHGDGGSDEFNELKYSESKDAGCSFPAGNTPSPGAI
jgi:hypothetical protein